MGVITHKRNRYRDDRITFADAKSIGLCKTESDFEKLTGRKAEVKAVKVADVKIEKVEEPVKIEKKQGK